MKRQSRPRKVVTKQKSRNKRPVFRKRRDSKISPHFEQLNGSAVKNGFAPRCQKCQGCLVVVPEQFEQYPEIRCINCGWQPRWGTRVIRETEESRSIRQFTTQLFSEWSRNGSATMLTRTSFNSPS